MHLELSTADSINVVNKYTMVDKTTIETKSNQTILTHRKGTTN